MENNTVLKNYVLSNNDNNDKLLQLPKENISYGVGKHNVKGSDIDYIHNAVVSIHEYPETDEVIQEYLDIFPDKVNERTKTGNFTPLMVLCQYLHQSSSIVLDILLEKGADVNAIDDYGKSVLNHCFEGLKNCMYDGKKYLSLIKILLEKGADVNTIDEYGKSILNHCLDGLKSVVYSSDKWITYQTLIKILLKKGADPDHIYQGKTVFLHYLKICDHNNYDEYPICKENMNMGLFISKSSDPGSIYKKNIRYIDIINNESLVKYLKKNIEIPKAEGNKLTSEQIEDLVCKINKLIE